jgi:intracellular sulfur oxidation DsrE/DsrF family protein
MSLNKIKIFSAIFTLALFLLPLNFLSAGELYGPQKVVYHFGTNNPQSNIGGLKNIQNHLNAVEKGKLQAVALVNSGGWEMVTKGKATPEMIDRMNSLIKQGVVFKICKNTIREKKINPETDLVIKMEIVPAGVAELVKLQDEGFRYIKP